MTRHQRVLVAVALSAVAADLTAKALGSALLDDRTIDLPGPLTLRLVHNPGVAFGLGDNAPTWIVLALTATITILLGVVAWRGALGPAGPVGLLLGGATANVIDRLQAGTVIDLFDLGWWPAFNLADTFITIGAGLALLRSYTAPAPQPLSPKPGPAADDLPTQVSPSDH